MALKKSELYSSLWSSCDELRGGMDASQYKDYVLVLLFIKYVSDKYAGEPYAAITVPKGASFQDMVALKDKPDIGDQINKKIIAPLANANKLSDMPDFNDANKLGTGKEMVDRLTNPRAPWQDVRALLGWTNRRLIPLLLSNQAHPCID
jgi:type I restriction enzyme M protein